MNMTNRKHVLCLFRTTKKNEVWKNKQILEFYCPVKKKKNYKELSFSMNNSNLKKQISLCMVKLSPKQSTHKNSRVVTQL